MPKDLKDVEPIIEAYGDLREITNIDVIIRSIANILSTFKGTYIFDPAYGVGIQRYIFEQLNQYTREALQVEISNALKIYEPRAKVKIDVIEDERKSKSLLITLNIKYEDKNKKVTVKINDTFLKEAPLTDESI